MLEHRVIPCLLLQNGGLVKTKQFKNPKYVGDPINAIRIFNEKEVDELMVLDIIASKQGREPDYSGIKQFASECFMPLCYGGGIRTIEQAGRIFSLGVEKICLQTAALSNPQLVQDITSKFGSQSVVVSLDIKRDWLGRYQLYQTSKSKIIDSPWEAFLQTAIRMGAGEILLNAVDRDGMLQGPDIELIQKATKNLGVPLIAVGGVGKLDDIKMAVNAGASAVAAGSFFVFHGPHRAVLITYPRYQELEALFQNL
ncbi:AglZ/HisF2 family acetamidino modification protein [Candidatus Synechococcus calcipolaris G9]|uniref:imidazole glycerol-phosphate synthase n=1 Tax=Candidatus Synechococcus calcipolaris G9 TaxID=1497997 RepID=A0ABT6EUP5_9SYNE|nr:AglZ/HisF2 family acetamidino modification protein [Candidatus Synechococcus calcipolaris]MDG2989578.1 AglZ/HisF2 family acetamidino modification protein [Candidatus Synechococcus calcipolaris G9]